MSGRVFDIKLMLIAFYCMVWTGATGVLARAFLTGSEGFWDKVFAWVFSVFLGAMWPIFAGARLMDIP